jgi:hypothetical protein
MRKTVLVKLFAFRFSLFAAIFFLLSIFYFLPSVAHANTTPQVNNYPAPNTNPDVPNTLHNWTQNVMIEVMLSLTCQLVGIDPTQPNGQCLGVDQKSGKIGFLPAGNLEKGEIGGAIGGMNNMITMLYTPPIHTGDYFQNLAQNFGINKKAYAQTTGTGFDSLSPLLNLWSAFRNIVYLIFVIVFIVIGLAIMLRIKIDPRTVMSIQNQIPKIIIGILVVTFSFAIAGFLIDLMWVSIYLIYGIFSGIQGVNLDSLNPANIQGQNALKVASHISGGGIFGITHNAAGSAKDALHGILNIKAGPLEIFNPFALVVDFFDPTKRGSAANWFIDLVSTGAGFVAFKYFLTVAETLSKATSLPVIESIPGIKIISDAIVNISLKGGSLAAFGFAEAVFAGTEALLRNWLPYLIAYLIIFIALLVALFRLWFTLIIAYVHILIDVVLAPFWIIGGIVPGSPISLSGWLRDLIANLAAFPAVIGMFMLGKVFMDAFEKASEAGQNPFAPPLIGDLGNPKMFSSLIGIGIILMTPNVVNMLKTALKAPKLDTGGVGKALGTSTGILQAPFKPLITGATFLGGQKLAAKFIPGLGQKGERPEAAK